MKVARRPTTAFSASITIHFFSTSAGFSEAVVFIMGLGFRKASEPGPRRERAHMPTSRGRVNSPAQDYGHNFEKARFSSYGNMVPLPLGELGLFLGEVGGGQRLHLLRLGHQRRIELDEGRIHRPVLLVADIAVGGLR